MKLVRRPSCHDVRVYLVDVLSIMHVVKSGSTCVMFLSIIKLTWKLPNNMTVHTNRSVSEKKQSWICECLYLKVAVKVALKVTSDYES
jgi:hypothetical protein